MNHMDSPELNQIPIVTLWQVPRRGRGKLQDAPNTVFLPVAGFATYLKEMLDPLYGFRGQSLLAPWKRSTTGPGDLFPITAPETISPLPAVKREVTLFCIGAGRWMKY